MFYLAVVPSSLFSLLAFFVLMLAFQGNDYLLSLLDLVTVKGIAVSILLLNLSSFLLILLSLVFVPPSITIYYGLSVVFVALMVGTWGVSSLGSVDLNSPYGQVSWSSGSDPLFAMLLFISAILFCVWRIDKLRSKK